MAADDPEVYLWHREGCPAVGPGRSVLTPRTDPDCTCPPGARFCINGYPDDGHGHDQDDFCEPLDED